MAKECPSVVELLDAANTAAWASHIADCARCQALIRHASADNELGQDSPTGNTYPHWNSSDLKADPEPGDVVSIFAPDSEVFLLGAVIRVIDGDALVAPISDETRYAAEWDLIVSQDVLGYEAIVELWNATSILVEQLKERIATITNALDIASAFAAFESGDAVPAGVYDGPPIVSGKDSRLGFRELEKDRVQPYAEPAALFASAETLGETLHFARDLLGLEIEDLSAASGIDEPLLVRIESDKQDLQGKVAIPHFIRLMRALSIPQSARFFSLAREAAWANASPRHFEKGVAFARRRASKRSTDKSITDEERDQIADEWIESLRRQLGGE